MTLLPYLLPLFGGLLFLFLPLLREFHFESALIASTVGAFWGGWKAVETHEKEQLKLGVNILIKLGIFGLPLLIGSLVRGCISWHGLGFWLLLPVPGVFFGIAVGRFFSLVNVPFTRFITVFTLGTIAIVVLLIELFTLPQVYFFNHVWGTWPGPIYDFDVEVTPALFVFRGITLLWICLLWVLPHWNQSKKHKLSSIFFAGLVLLSFFFRPELGITSPNYYLKQQLNQPLETEHFRLFFDPEYFSAEEMEYWALRHEFHFAQIVSILDIDWPQNRKIESYLYGNAWQKKRLVGAKYTSYVPVWLEQDQLHIAKEHLHAVLKHELVHVIAKQFGNALFNASWSIGLVEGLAEAIAADASEVSTLDQIMAAERPFPTAEEMQNALTFKGFYSSAGSVSYTTAGSFVQFLIENYPIEHLKQAYRQSSFEKVYKVSFDQLVDQWLNQLPVSEIDSLDEQTSKAIFSQQSLFQLNCPHTLTPILKRWETINRLELSHDSVGAFSELNALFADRPNIPLIKRKWAEYHLHFGQLEPVISNFSNTDSIPTFPLIKADAYLMAGNVNAAHSLYHQIKSTADSSNTILMESLEVRSDSLLWNVFINARYKNQLPSAKVFQQLPIQLKWLVLSRSIQHNRHQELLSFVEVFDLNDLNTQWFDRALEVIDRLVFLQEYEHASRWIEHLETLNLRDRYMERLEESKEWLSFVSFTTHSMP